MRQTKISRAKKLYNLKLRHGTICICKKEARETKYWLQLIAKSNPEKKEECRRFWQEAQELTLIFSKIIITIDKEKLLKIN